MNNLDRTLREMVALIERLQMPYVLMGGLAVRVYGIPRPTYDIDFTLAIPRSSLNVFYRDLQALGYTVPEPYLTGWVDCVAGMPVVKIRFFGGENGIDVDFFLAESDYQHQVLTRRRREKIDDLDVWVVGPEDLILLKLISRRPRDMADIGDILFTQGQLDIAYMRSWAEKLHIGEHLEQVLSEVSS
ncbi:MAG: nucleotidyltransferase [Pirellulales bacterium]|nr:nucleotidyltransferase [Pirellulales bacterium]